MTKEQILQSARNVCSQWFCISVNSGALSHNINIDSPQYKCLAISEAEAVGKMMLSDFPHKNKPIIKVMAY